MAFTANHARRWLIIVGASLLVHATLLSGLRWTWSERPAPLGGAPLRVRILESVVTVPDSTTDERHVEGEPPASPRARASPARAAPRPHVAQAAPRRAAQPPTRTPAGADAGTPSVVEPPLASALVHGEAAVGIGAASAPARPEDVPSSVDGETIPLYPTAFPPAASARYRVTRGARAGEGDLAWSPSAQGYRLTFDAPDVGWTQSSEGAFDAAGLAPRRYLERTSKALRATNFDADAGMVRFSASNARQPWLPGSQDRLGWIVQLGAVLAADSGVVVAGRRIVLRIAGVRGEAQRWEFVVREVSTAESSPGATAVVHLVREPPSSKDLGIDVWIDPAAPALPLRVEWRTPLAGIVLCWERLELRP